MRPYLFLPCLLLGACAATHPWGPPGGHVYGGHQAVYSRGHCPPGLAKKGCIPPGQATKWRRGYRCDNKKCRINLTNHRKFLHAHHINGQKSDNSPDNIKLLCIKCHAEEYLHGHLKSLPEYIKFTQMFGE